jgi:hypothetical protein
VQAIAGNTILSIGVERRTAIEIRPRNSVASPAVIPRPIVKPAAVKMVLSGGMGHRPALVRVMEHRVGNNQALAIVQVVEQTGPVEEAAIEAGAEVHHLALAREGVVAAAPLAGDRVV